VCSREANSGKTVEKSSYSKDPAQLQIKKFAPRLSVNRTLLGYHGIIVRALPRDATVSPHLLRRHLRRCFSTMCMHELNSVPSMLETSRCRDVRYRLDEFEQMLPMYTTSHSPEILSPAFSSGNEPYRPFRSKSPSNKNLLELYTLVIRSSASQTPQQEVAASPCRPAPEPIQTQPQAYPRTRSTPAVSPCSCSP
jgi:hypothetical protein